MKLLILCIIALALNAEPIKGSHKQAPKQKQVKSIKGASGTKKPVVKPSAKKAPAKPVAKPVTTNEKKLAEEFAKLTDEQKEVIYRSYRAGRQQKAGQALAAIAWKESSAGKQTINVNNNGSWDCGLYGVNTSSVLNRAGEKISSSNRGLVCTKLIRDDSYAFSKAMEELKHWEKYWGKMPQSKKNLYVWGSYHGGTRSNMDYAKDIEARIKVINKNMKELSGSFEQNIAREERSSEPRG